jgi:hypothetical protein
VTSYLPQTWFDARLAVGPARVHGHGIYATSPIAQAENLWVGDEVTLLARFDIARGEELLIDYAMVESEADYVLDACRCDSDHCRVVITGQDWRQPTLQERYQDRFLPFINERIAQLGGTGRPPA